MPLATLTHNHRQETLLDIMLRPHIPCPHPSKDEHQLTIMGTSTRLSSVYAPLRPCASSGPPCLLLSSWQVSRMSSRSPSCSNRRPSMMEICSVAGHHVVVEGPPQQLAASSTTKHAALPTACTTAATGRQKRSRRGRRSIASGPAQMRACRNASSRPCDTSSPVSVSSTTVYICGGRECRKAGVGGRRPGDQCRGDQRLQLCRSDLAAATGASSSAPAPSSASS